MPGLPSRSMGPPLAAVYTALVLAVSLAAGVESEDGSLADVGVFLIGAVLMGLAVYVWHRSRGRA